jgi:hypothetical protein
MRLSNSGTLPLKLDRHVRILPVIFLPSDSLLITATLVPDDLEPTAAEVVAAYQAQVRRAENLRNAPLITQEMRDRQQREKYKKWPDVSNSTCGFAALYVLVVTWALIQWSVHCANPVS